MNAVTQTLTEQQAAFVAHVSRGMSHHDAARLSGYSPESVNVAVYRLRNNPLVQTAIANAVRQFLHTEAAPAAIKLMYDVMVDEKHEPKLRVACAKTLADRAGFIAPKAMEHKGIDGKSLVDMSAEELREQSQRIMRELSDRSTTIVDVTPDNAPPSQADDVYPIDILG